VPDEVPPYFFFLWARTHALFDTNNRCTHTYTTILLLFWNLSGTTRVSSYQKGKTRKGKTNLYLLEQEIVSGSGTGIIINIKQQRRVKLWK